MDVLHRAFALGATTRSDKGSGFAFPSRNSGRPLTRHAFMRATKRMTKVLRIPDATPHDFRRTGATNLTSERIGVSHFVVSRVLNQISDAGGAAPVTGVYDRNEYLPEKRRALGAWSALLQEIVMDRTRPPNVGCCIHCLAVSCIDSGTAIAENLMGEDPVEWLAGQASRIRAELSGGKLTLQ